MSLMVSALIIIQFRRVVNVRNQHSIEDRMEVLMLNSQKAENELNLALDATQSERERSVGLETGYDPRTRT